MDDAGFQTAHMVGYRCPPARVGPALMRALALIAVLWALSAAPAAHGGVVPPPVPAPPQLPVPAPSGGVPALIDICPLGEPPCLDEVIASQQRHFDELVRACDHNAVFALAYLRTTQEVKPAILLPGMFDNPAALIHLDAVFADEHARQWTAHRAGRTAEVAPAWRIAFEAADRGRLWAAGDLMLGLNAHISRDLPYVLERVGLTEPDGRSRKADFDRANVPIGRVTRPLRREVARRLDPTIAKPRAPGRLDEAAVGRFITAARARAWRFAELLVAAPNPVARALVAARIERESALQARTITSTFRYPPRSGQRAKRVRWCRAHRNA